jgi:hypothetical protein
MCNFWKDLHETMEKSSRLKRGREGRRQPAAVVDFVHGIFQQQETQAGRTDEKAHFTTHHTKISSLHAQAHIRHG